MLQKFFKNILREPLTTSKVSIKSIQTIKEFFEVIYSSLEKKNMKYLWNLRKSTWDIKKKLKRLEKAIKFFGNIFREWLKNELYKFTRSIVKFRKAILVKTVMEFWESPCKEAQKIFTIWTFYKKNLQTYRENALSHPLFFVFNTVSYNWCKFYSSDFYYTHNNDPNVLFRKV